MKIIIFEVRICGILVYNPHMIDILRELNEPNDGIEVELQKDVFVFKKHAHNHCWVYKEAVLEKGERVLVGGACDIIRLHFDHKAHEFTPWLDNPDQIQGDEASIRYLRTSDLPDNF